MVRCVLDPLSHAALETRISSALTDLISGFCPTQYLIKGRARCSSIEEIIRYR